MNEKIMGVAAGAAPIDPIATIVDATCDVMSKAGERIDQLIERVNALSRERAELLAALETIADAHLGDCPAAQTPLGHAQGHIAYLRKLALDALDALEQAEPREEER